MTDYELRSLQRGIRDAAVPGKAIRGFLIIVLCALVGCGLFGALFVVQLLFDLTKAGY
jgi:hypothetical protein